MSGSGRQRAGRLVSHQFVNFDIQTCSDAELDTPHGDMGEAAGQMIAPLAGQLNKRCGLNLQAVEPVRDDDAALVWPRKQVPRESFGDSEIEPVRPFRIFLPFPVTDKILTRRFHLDDGDFAATADGDQINAPSAAKGEFPQAGIAALDEHTGDSAGNPFGGYVIGRVHAFVHPMFSLADGNSFGLVLLGLSGHTLIWHYRDPKKWVY